MLTKIIQYKHRFHTSVKPFCLETVWQCEAAGEESIFFDIKANSSGRNWTVCGLVGGDSHALDSEGGSQESEKRGMHHYKLFQQRNLILCVK